MSVNQQLLDSWKAAGIAMPAPTQDHAARDRARIAARFDRQSAFWDLLASAAGYPRAYRDLFARLRTAGLLPIRPHRVLDAGAGTGTLALAYTHVSPDPDITVLDVSRRMLSRAARNLDRRRARAATMCGDVAHLPFPDAHFDLVMSAHCIDHTLDPSAAVAELARVLRPGGTLVFVAGRSGPLDCIAKSIWHYRSIAATDVLAWMWDANVQPVGSLRFGRSSRLAYWLSEAAIGRKERLTR